MQASANHSLSVRSSKHEIWLREEHVRLPLLAHRLVERDDELLLILFLADEPDWDVDEIHPRFNAFKPTEGFAEVHGNAESNVVWMVSLASSPFVSRILVRSDCVIVWTILRSKSVRRQDREGGFISSYLSDTRLSDKWNPTTLELESLQFVPRGYAAVAR
jgi:hypothetical protein